MPRLSINVDDRSLDTTLDKLDDVVTEAVDNNVGDMLDAAIDRGKKHIRDEEAVWRKEVLGLTMHADFDWTEITKGEQYAIWNSARHAGIVDEGTQFDDHPRAGALVPWVLDNLDDWHPFEDDDADRVTVDTDDGGGLGAIAEQVGTVTEEQDGGDDYGLTSGAGDEVTSRWNTGTHNWDARHNGKNSNPTAFTYEIADTIDLNTAEMTANQVTNGEYPTLNDDESQALRDLLADVYDPESVDFLYDSHENWKQTSFDWNGWWLERQVQRTYGIDADIRESHNRVKDETSIPPSVAELGVEQEQEIEQIYHELSAISTEYLKRHVADDRGNLRVHRGLRGTQTADIGKSFFDDPDRDHVEIEDSVVQNYSTAEGAKTFFSEGAEVSLTVDSEEEVLVAPDFIMDGAIQYAGEKYKDAEVHVIGGRRQIDTDEVTFDGFDPNDLMSKSFSLYSEDEHEAIRRVVLEMDERDRRVQNEESATFLKDWAKDYNKNGPGYEDMTKPVNRVTEEVGNPLDEFDTARYDTQVWYGQEVEDAFGVTKHVDYVDEDTIYFDNGDTMDDDVSSLKSGFETFQNWYDLDPDERRDQLRNELRSKPVKQYNRNTDTEEQVVTDAEKSDIIDKVVDHFMNHEADLLKDEEDLRRLVHNMEYISIQDADFIASVSAGEWDGSYALNLTDSVLYGNEAHRTLAHELGHALMAVNGWTTGNADISSNFAKGVYDSDRLPIVTAFNPDGTVDTAALDSDEEHFHAPNYMFIDMEDATIDENYLGKYVKGNAVGYSDWNKDVDWITDNWFSFKDGEAPTTIDDHSELDPSGDRLQYGDYLEVTREVSQLETEGLVETTTPYIYRGAEYEESFGNKFYTLHLQKTGDGKMTTMRYMVEDDEFAGATELKYAPKEELDIPPDNALVWSPSEEDDWERLAESANRAWWTAVLAIQKDDDPAARESAQMMISDGYSVSSADELIARLRELFRTESDVKAENLREIYQAYPYLIRAYLAVDNPSPKARRILEQIDDEELQDLL